MHGIKKSGELDRLRNFAYFNWRDRDGVGGDTGDGGSEGAVRPAFCIATIAAVEMPIAKKNDRSLSILVVLKSYRGHLRVSNRWKVKHYFSVV